MVGHPTPIIANLTRIKCHAPEEVGREAIKTSQSSVVWDGPAVSHWSHCRHHKRLCCVEMVVKMIG